MASSVSSLTRNRVPALLVYLLAVVVVSGLGGLATSGAVSSGGWYAEADKPFFTPPSFVFGPVWTVLYLAIAVAAWRLSRHREAQPEATHRALLLWWIQLGLNLLWSPVFFAAQLLWAGLVVIVTLDLVLAVLVAKAWRLDRIAGLLLAPYLAWVLFATALTAGFALLN